MTDYSQESIRSAIASAITALPPASADRVRSFLLSRGFLRGTPNGADCPLFHYVQSVVPESERPHVSIFVRRAGVDLRFLRTGEYSGVVLPPSATDFIRAWDAEWDEEEEDEDDGWGDEWDDEDGEDEPWDDDCVAGWETDCDEPWYNEDDDLPEDEEIDLGRPV